MTEMGRLRYKNTTETFTVVDAQRVKKAKCRITPAITVTVKPRRSVALSIFIGMFYLLAYVPFAPLTVMWVIGERAQGRIGIQLRHDRFSLGGLAGNPTLHGWTLGITGPIFTILYSALILIGSLL